MIPIRDSRLSDVFPYVTIALIALNFAAFFYQVTLPTNELVLVDGSQWVEKFNENPPGFNYQIYVQYGRDLFYPLTKQNYFIAQYGLIPAEFWSGEDLPPEVPIPIWLTMFTAMFLHGGWLHILGNMLYLWIFGDNVEAAMGHGRFLLFYLLSGAGAALLQLGVSAGSTMPMVGASGAIAGVMGAYLVLFPFAQVLTAVPIFFFIHLVELPAVIFLGLWFLLQFFSGIVDLESMGGVAWFAHLGGFLTGALLVFPLKRREVVPGLVAMFRGHRSPWG